MDFRNDLTAIIRDIITTSRPTLSGLTDVTSDRKKAMTVDDINRLSLLPNS